MRVVGLTGGIGTGKSTVSRLLASQHGFVVVDCDALAHGCVAPGSWGYKRVVAAFGPSVLAAADGSDGQGAAAGAPIDREALGRLAFSDAGARRRLNRATHLPVAVALAARVVGAWLQMRTVVIVDMPLLFETGAHRWLRPVVVVVAGEAAQLARVTARDGLSRAGAAARVAAQMPVAEKAAKADILIDNSGTLGDLEAQVAVLAARLRKGARLRGVLTSPVGVAALAVAARALLPRLLGAMLRL